MVPETVLPIPEHGEETIQAYLNKHLPIEDNDSQRLQDELVAIWNKLAKDQPERYPIFLHLLRELRPAIRGAARWLQWWDTLVLPVLKHMGEERSLASECRKLLLEIIAFEPDDGDSARIEATRQTSIAISEKIIEIWLKQSAIANAENDSTAQWMADQIKIALLAFGQKKPQELLEIVNKYFVNREHRNQMAALLVTFFKQGPPHLHLMLQTPLFDNLLRCLQIDTSTTVIAQAMTALTMFLPHIPVTSGKHLPALFNIYTRMLFWERGRTLSPRLRHGSDDGSDSPDPTIQTACKVPWEKLSYSFSSTDSSMPDLLHYFTFLYGLYPINFMSYIRKPSRYLRHANFAGADDIDVEPSEIRLRSDKYRELHLLHPNFFTHTIESEITDAQRWMNHAASDVVTFCMTLNVPQELAYSIGFTEQPPSTLPVVEETPREMRSGGLLTHSSSRETFHTHRSSRADDVQSAMSSRHHSIVSPGPPTDGTVELSALARLSSRNASVSSEVPSAHLSTPQESSRPESSATNHSAQPPQPDAMPSLQEMLASNSQHTSRSNLRHSLRNDLPTTLSTLANNDALVDSNRGERNVDMYLQFLQQPTAPRSPSLHPSNPEISSAISSLQREIVLLKNDLSFERYLKQQHLSHIGKLRRQQVREATIEAETQAFVNNNKTLKKSLEDKEREVLQVKKDMDRSRALSRKWEEGLSTKLRVVKEEQKLWRVEKQRLKTRLEESKTKNDGLKKLVIESEEREVESERRLEGIKIELEQLHVANADVQRLKQRLRKYMTQERDIERMVGQGDVAASKIKMLELALVVRDNELEELKLANTREIEQLKSDLERVEGRARKEASKKVQGMVDAAVAANQGRLNNLQKQYYALKRRFADVQAENLQLRGKTDDLEFKVSIQRVHPGSSYDNHIGMNPLSPYTKANQRTMSAGADDLSVASPTPSADDVGSHITPSNSTENGKGSGRDTSLDSTVPRMRYRAPSPSFQAHVGYVGQPIGGSLFGTTRDATIVAPMRPVTTHRATERPMASRGLTNPHIGGLAPIHRSSSGMSAPGMLEAATADVAARSEGPPIADAAAAGVGRGRGEGTPSEAGSGKDGRRSPRRRNESKSALYGRGRTIFEHLF